MSERYSNPPIGRRQRLRASPTGSYAPGGHPYLVRLALYEATVRHLSLDKMETEAARGIGPFAQHLDRMMLSLDQDSSGLIDAIRQILQDKPCEERAFVRLLAAGVVTDAPDGGVCLRCRLYRDYLWRLA